MDESDILCTYLPPLVHSPRHCNKLSGGKNGEIIGTKLTDFNTAVCTAVIKDQQKKLTRRQSTLLLKLVWLNYEILESSTVYMYVQPDGVSAMTREALQLDPTQETFPALENA